MKIALIHDYLNQYGGAERVLETLMEIFPEAPIYTLIYDEKRTLNRFHGRIRKTSFLDFELARRYHRAFIPLMPLAIKTLRLDEHYDLIISDSAGFAKGINLKTQLLKGVKHISYIHTPLRYAWEPHYINSKFKNQNSKLMGLILKPLLAYLRHWDYQAAQQPDILIANSQFIADKIKKYYNREALVIYPPVDTAKFYLETKNQKPKIKDFYLAVGRLLHYKRFDLVIDAFAKLGLPLKIVGSGPEENKIKNQISSRLKQSEWMPSKVEASTRSTSSRLMPSEVKASKIKNIELIPFIKDDELRRLYNSAKALIFPQVEDFGLVAAEAQACGCPVIAYAAGGALEIIEPGESGLFFTKQTPESLIEIVKKFEKMNLNRQKISQFAQKFSKERFKKEFLAAIISQLNNIQK